MKSDQIFGLHTTHHQTFKSYSMKKNMGSTDKLLRVLVAVVIAVLYVTGVIYGTLGIVLLVLGIVFVLTSMVSFCPLYVPFGINTCAKDK